MTRHPRLTFVLSAVLGAGLALSACSSGGGSAGPSTTQAPSTTSNEQGTTTTGVSTTGACPGQLTAPISIDRTSYEQGGVLTVEVKLTNVSQRPCTVPRDFPEPFEQHFEVVDATGRTVWKAEICAMGLAARPQPRTLEAGESMGWVTAKIPLLKDVNGCNRDKQAPLPAGVYTVRTTSSTPNGQIAQQRFTIS